MKRIVALDGSKERRMYCPKPILARLRGAAAARSAFDGRRSLTNCVRDLSSAAAGSLGPAFGFC